MNISIVKRIFIFIAKAFGFLMLFLLAYVIIGWGLSKFEIAADDKTSDDISIYIKTNGVHTDIVLPTKTKWKDWSKQLKFEHLSDPNKAYKFVAMGWGDKGFYLETPTWSDLNFSTALKATTGLSTSAMHVTHYDRMQENEDCIKIDISLIQYQRLIEFIDASFQKDTNQNYSFINTESNYGTNDAFYEAEGSYSLFKTCNSWANSALKYSGQKAALWTALDTGIFDKYR
jgi:uncharacterized protein (TIGR02117 family)